MQKFLIKLAKEIAKSTVAVFLLLCLIQLAVWVTGYDFQGGVFSKESISSAIIVYLVCVLLSLFVNIKLDISFSKGDK